MRFLLVIALLFAATATQAAEVTLHGGIKNESAYFVQGQQRWDKIQNRLELKPEANFDNGWEFRSRALLWYDAAMDIEATRPPELTSAIKAHYRTVAQLKEAYLLYGGDAFDLRLGQQQIVWGKTDGLRLLDIVNPLDLREFILDDFLDSRIGMVAARLNWYPDSDIEQEFEFLLIPDAQVARLAPLGSRWAVKTPPPPAGLAVRLLPEQRPGWSLRDSEAGLAWRATIAGWDVSLNYFHGWKHLPNILRRVSPGLLEIQPVHFRRNMLGGAFANAFGPLVLRGELAIDLRESIDRLGTTFAASIARKTTFNAAIGADWTKHHWTISPQFFIRHIANWQTGLLEPPNSGFWTLRVATDFLHERLKPEVIVLGDWAAGGWLARPKIAYDWSDQFTTTLGADIFGGHRGLLGQFANNDRIYVEAEYTF